MAESVIFLREQSIKSLKQLDEYIQKASDERQNLQDKTKAIDKEMQELSATMERVHAKKYRHTTRDIRQTLLTRHVLRSTKLRLPSTKTLFRSLKNPISRGQIQEIF